MARRKAVFMNICLFIITSCNNLVPVIRSIVTMTVWCCGVDAIMTIPAPYVIDFSTPGIIFHREM
jgi:hypothetical protein